MRLWVVTHWQLSGDEEDTAVVGVFSSNEAARDFINKQKYYPANQDYFCQEFELDKPEV